MYNRFSLENYHDGIFNLTTKKASMVPTFDPVKLCVTLFRDRRFCRYQRYGRSSLTAEFRQSHYNSWLNWYWTSEFGHLRRQNLWKHKCRNAKKMFTCYYATVYPNIVHIKVGSYLKRKQRISLRSLGVTISCW